MSLTKALIFCWVYFWDSLSDLTIFDAIDEVKSYVFTVRCVPESIFYYLYLVLNKISL